MPYDPNIHKRRSIRIQGYDYTQPGAYFITIVTHKRRPLFGQAREDGIERSKLGEMVHGEWKRLERRFTGITLGQWIIMPDHIHGILVLSKSNLDSEATSERFGMPVAGSVPTIVRAFKSATTLRFHMMENTSSPLWQRNYYEHILRDEREWENTRLYILDNPRRWWEKEQDIRLADSHQN